MGDERGVASPVVSLVELLDGGVLSEGRGGNLEDEPGENVPENENDGSEDSDEFGELFREEDYIEDGLREVGVDHTQAVGPFLRGEGEKKKK